MSFKTLYILRHAEAANAGALTDFERPLTPKGLNACASLATQMHARGWRPAYVLASPAQRTRETAEAVMHGLGIAPSIRFVDKLYLAAAGELSSLVKDVPEETESLLLVGHNPGIQQFCSSLSATDGTGLGERIRLSFPTAALAVITIDGTWKDMQPGTGTLVNFLTI